MEKYYKKLSLLLSENKNISKDDEELYEYAIKVLSQGVIGFFVSIFIGFSVYKISNPLKPYKLKKININHLFCA